MGRSSYFKGGDWNIICDTCGVTIKASQARKMWNGMYVCPEHWDRRQPLDFPVYVNPLPALPFTRPGGIPGRVHPRKPATCNGDCNFALGDVNPIYNLASRG